MQVAYCPNCGKNTGHKRALGAGTIIGAVVTAGVSLLAVPGYGKRCVICGLTVAEAAPKQDTLKVTARDEAQGWLVLLGVIALIALWWHCS
jgi:hypothetical protein